MSTIIRWNPIREMAAMQRAMDRFFDDAWRNVQPSNGDDMLALDVHEGDNNYVVIATIPGINPDDIQISLHDGALTVGAELPQPTVAEGVRVLLQERRYGQISRTINLPQPVDSDKVEAVYDNGVLTLTLPIAESAKPRHIPVKPVQRLASKN